MHKSSDHAYFAGLARLQKFHPRDVVRRSAPVRSDLDNTPTLSSGPDHCSTFHDRVADWLLNVDMGPRPDCCDGDEWMPVIRRSNDNDLRTLAFQHFSIVLVSLGLVTGEPLDFGDCRVQLILVYVAHRNHPRLAGLHRGSQNVHAPPSRAYQGRRILLVLRWQ